ncbi:hypothetical protein GF380_02320 [Candidatus Uhrbacteria bacterium]|nr:hypothetical protein [Candidatus Uhrbacteria bacterium]
MGRRAVPLERQRGILRSIFDRLPGASRDPDLTNKGNALYAVMQFRGGELNRLKNVIERRYINAYQSEIARQLQRVGCSGVVSGPSGRELAHLRGLVERDASSIQDTFNKELKNEIKRQVAAHPDWSRRQFRRALEEWQGQRLATKNKLIANATKGNAAEYAIERFIAENGLTDTLYIWDATPPIVFNSHQECIRRVRLGGVTWEVARNWQRTHPNCRHRVSSLSTVRLNCREVWRG